MRKQEEIVMLGVMVIEETEETEVIEMIVEIVTSAEIAIVIAVDATEDVIVTVEEIVGEGLLVHEPQLLLLDEPFGALDQFTREELWDTMQSLWIAQRPTVLLVTRADAGAIAEAAHTSDELHALGLHNQRLVFLVFYVLKQSFKNLLDSHGLVVCEGFEG